MTSRFGWFVLGGFTAAAAFVVGAYLFVALGGMPMATTAPPLPFETTLAKMAIHAAVADARSLPDPLPFNEANMIAGAHLYKEHCAFCHGIPGGTRSPVAQGEFPPPPQLFKPDEMVTDDPEGVSHWKVTHGIRLSGMPGFGDVLTDEQRWQLAMLVAHADKLTPAVSAVFADNASNNPSAKNGSTCSCMGSMSGCSGMKSMMPSH